MTLLAVQPDDLHRRRWIMFVDGENFTIRGQRVADAEKITFDEGQFYRKDVFLWLPRVSAGRGPIRALHLRGETVKRVSLIGRNSGGPLCRSQ